jgi:hypothetical protein
MAQDNIPKVVTAPFAAIKINGIVSGFMQNVRCTENIQRGRVQGIGNLTLKAVPATGYTCQLTADFYFISFARPEVKALLNRFSGSLENFINTLIMGEVPPQIQMFKKMPKTIVNGIVTEITDSEETLAVIRDFYPDSNSFDISEGQISRTNISGTYLTPVFFNQY